MNPLILHIDDSDVLPDGVAAALRKDGYRVQHTADPEEAMRLREAEAPALVLMEIEMQACEGLDLMAGLRGPQLGSVPILVLTRAPRDSAVHGEAIALGVADFLTKPVRAADLLAAIHEVVPPPGRAAPKAPTAVDLSGEFTDTPMPELLARLRRRGANGVLAAGHEGTRVGVQLRNGSPVGVSSSRPEIVAEAALFETFRWETGRYAFSEGRTLDSGAVLELPDDPAALLLTGVLDASPARLVHERLAKRESLYVAATGASESALEAEGFRFTGEQRQLIRGLGGGDTLSVLLESGAFQEKLVYGLWVGGWLELSTAPTLTLTDLLGELSEQEPELGQPESSEDAGRAIRKLERTREEQERGLEELARKRAERERELETLARVRAEQERKLEALAPALDARSQELAALARKRKAHSRELAELRRARKERARELEALARVREEHERELEALAPELDARSQELAALGRKREAHARELEELGLAREKHERELEELARTREEQARELEQLAPALDERSQELAQLAREREESAQELTELAREREESAQELAELQRAREEREGELEELERQRDQRARELEELAPALDERNQELEALARARAEHEQELEELARAREERARVLEELARTREESARELEELGRARDERAEELGRARAAHARELEELAASSQEVEPEQDEPEATADALEEASAERETDDSELDLGAFEPKTAAEPTTPAPAQAEPKHGEIAPYAAARTRDGDDLTRTLHDLAERVLAGDDFQALGIAPSASDEEARAAYEAILEQVPRVEPTPANLVHAQRAKRIRARIEAAYANLQDAEKRRAYSLMREEEEQDRKAKPSAERALEGERWFRKGKAHLERRRCSEAIEAFGMAAHLDPEQGEYASHLGYALFLSNPKDDVMQREAMEHVAKGIKCSPGNETSYLYLGRILTAKGEFDVAKKILHKALRIKPDFHPAVRELRLLEMRERKAKGVLSRLIRR